MMDKIQNLPGAIPVGTAVTVAQVGVETATSATHSQSLPLATDSFQEAQIPQISALPSLGTLNSAQPPLPSLRTAFFEHILTDACGSYRAKPIDVLHDGVRYTSDGPSYIRMEFQTGTKLYTAMNLHEDLTSVAQRLSEKSGFFPFVEPVYYGAEPLLLASLHLDETVGEKTLDTILHSSNGSVSAITELARRYIETDKRAARYLFLASYLALASNGRVPYADFMLARASMAYAGDLMRRQELIGGPNTFMRYHGAIRHAIEGAQAAAVRYSQSSGDSYSAELLSDIGSLTRRYAFIKTIEAQRAMWPFGEKYPSAENLPHVIELALTRLSVRREEGDIPKLTQLVLSHALHNIRINAFNEALAYLPIAHAMNPRHEVIVTLYSKALRRTGKCDKARTIIERLLSTSPSASENPYVLHEYAVVLGFTGDTELSAQILQRLAVRIESQGFPILDEEKAKSKLTAVKATLGHVYKRAKMYEEAIAVFSQAKDDVPKFANIADVYFKIASDSVSPKQKIAMLLNCRHYAKLALTHALDEHADRSFIGELYIESLGHLAAQLRRQDREEEARKFESELSEFLKARNA